MLQEEEKDDPDDDIENTAPIYDLVGIIAKPGPPLFLLELLPDFEPFLLFEADLLSLFLCEFLHVHLPFLKLSVGY
jgi:hypothetical protein